MKKYKLKLDYTADELKELRRLSKDYTADELKELRRLSKDYKSPMNAIKQIVKEGVVGDQLGHLREKYLAMEYEDEFDFMADVNNVVMGTAIFPKEKYVVHDKVTDRYVRFNTLEETFCWSQLRRTDKRTKEEWLAINPAYETMLEKVGD